MFEGRCGSSEVFGSICEQIKKLEGRTTAGGSVSSMLIKLNLTACSPIAQLCGLGEGSAMREPRDISLAF